MKSELTVSYLSYALLDIVVPRSVEVHRISVGTNRVTVEYLNPFNEVKNKMQRDVPYFYPVSAVIRDFRVGYMRFIEGIIKGDNGR